MTPQRLPVAVRALLRRTAETYHDDPHVVDWMRHHLERFDGPLNVVLAGMVKSGKSTLLNALVGERIAPTDSTECTQVVTWYRDGNPPGISVVPRTGPPRESAVARRNGALVPDFAGLPVEQVDRLEVRWPSQYLRAMTLVDTPGIASMSADSASRAGVFVVPDGPSVQADAVVYLMRHLHSADFRFLESFSSAGTARSAPINTIAVLSRADEIGAGRLDALGSARRIARKYRSDDTLRRHCQTVVAVAGLLAETGRTMTQQEFGALVALAGLPRSESEAMLLSAGRFVGRACDAVDGPTRAGLVERFGLFGLRLSLTLIRQGISDAPAVAAELVRRSGLDELRAVITDQFADRRELLKARSALLAIDLVLSRHKRPGLTPLAAELERVVAGAHEFVELRLLARIRSGAVQLPAPLLAEAEELLGGRGFSAAARLGIDPSDDLRSASWDAVGRWRRHAESPLASGPLTEVARVVVRSCEGLLESLPG